MKVLSGFLIAASFLSIVQSTTWESCGKNVPQLPIKSFWIDTCPGKIDGWGHECPVTPGKKLEVKVEFRVPHGAAVIKPRQKIFKWGINLLQRDVSDLDVCTTLIKGKCPLKKDEVVTAHFWLDTEDIKVPWFWIFPEVDVEVSFHNEKGEDLGCLMIPIIIYNNYYLKQLLRPNA